MKDFDGKTFFIVDNLTRKRIASAFTSKGIHAIIYSNSYKIIDRMMNEFHGFDILVSKSNPL